MNDAPKFTPGPWSVEAEGTVRNDADGLPRYDLPRIVRYDGNGLSICKAHLVGGPDPDPAIANARLIAAAPDLFAALEALIAIDEDTTADGATLQARVDVAWGAAQAAIAKALGK